MKAGDCMNFLHISDIHFDLEDSGRATRDLRAKFKSYVKEKGIKNINKVFFTGDFRPDHIYKEHELERLAKNAVDFICELARAVGVSDPQNIHIVPGDHDRDRLSSVEFEQCALESIYDQYDRFNGRFSGKVQEDVMASEFLRSRFVFFEKCAQLLDNKVWSEFKTGLIHRAQVYDDYAIIYLNTAIASGLTGEQKLLLGTDDFDLVVKSTNNKPLFILAHHSISDFDDNEQNIIKNILNDNQAPVLWFCGNTHKSQYDNTYNICVLTAGSMIQVSDTEASFYTGQFARYEGVTVTAHTYEPDHGYWQQAEAITKRIRESIPVSIQPAPEERLPEIHNIPGRYNYFAGRKQQIRAIAEKFNDSQGKVSKQAVLGLGGIGKTQLARQYMHVYSSFYETAIWEINAETSATIQLGFNQLVKKLGLDVPQELSEEELSEVIKDWMQCHDKWIILFDNLEFEDLVLPYIPDNNMRGHLLATTRNADLNWGDTLSLDSFSLVDAADFLDRRLFGCEWLKTTEETLKVELINRLGGLPLALEQAAAYMKTTRTDYSSYLDLLSEVGLKEFALNETSFGKPKNYLDSVVSTWEISFRCIAKEGAKQLLYLCSYLGAEKIPIKLFANRLEMLPDPLCIDLATIRDRNIVLSELRKYSLVGGDAKSINIHRLVQAVIRDKLSEEKWPQYCLELLGDAYCFEYSDKVSHNEFLMYTPHVESLLNIVSNKSFFGKRELQERIIHLWRVGGSGNLNLGNYKRAIAWYQKALLINETLHKEAHLDTANILNNLASAYDGQGNYKKALELYHKSLEVSRKLFPEDHPDIATSYSNIASVHDILGEFGDALKWYQKAIEISIRVLGEDDFDTAVTYNNMAGVINRLGDYQTALELYEKAMKGYKKNLGEKHPDMANIYNNIADVYDNLGEYAKALRLYEKALKIGEEILGFDHPDIAIYCNNIAYVYCRQGLFSEARIWYKRALDINMDTLGEEHPEVATSYNNLGSLYNELGDYKKAGSFYKRALEIYQKALGSQHPEVANASNNIAVSYIRQGEYDSGEWWYKKALEIREKAFGFEHPETATSYCNIGVLYDRRGDFDAAEEYCRKSLFIREKLLGRENPDTATSYNCLGNICFSRNEFRLAVEWYLKALRIRINVLGAEHPDVAALYNNLAVAYDSMKNYKEAIKYYQRALEIDEALYGTEHPATATTYDNLAAAYGSSGELEKALELHHKALKVRGKNFDKQHPEIAHSYNNIAHIYFMKAQYDEAEKWYVKALEILEEKFGSDHHLTQMTKENIANIPAG